MAATVHADCRLVPCQHSLIGPRALGYNTPAEIEANPTLLLSVMERSIAGSSATCPDFTVSH
jgi:hypothetical protein